MCRLPIPRPGGVLGLVGTNGIGKSTALKILAGKQKPNLGNYDVSITGANQACFCKKINKYNKKKICSRVLQIGKRS